MTKAIALQIDRQADLALVDASRGELPLATALESARAALAIWTELGEAYWAEQAYWTDSIRYAERTGRIN